MKKLTPFIIAALFVFGCASPGPYVPPPECDNADSVILSHFDDPRQFSDGLIAVNMVALESLDNYHVDDALEVLTQVEDMLTASDMSYSNLVVYLQRKLKVANNLAGAMVFLMSEDISRLKRPDLVSDCDKALVKKHLEKQMQMLSMYGQE